MGMGPSNRDEWPAAARRHAPEGSESGAVDLMVPALRDGRRNLALLPAAAARASSTIPGYAIHQAAHLIDGWYGNGNSWVAETMPAWVEIDLGAVYTLGSVRLGNDQGGDYHDRAATGLTVKVAAEPGAWRAVAHSAEPLDEPRTLTFEPAAARWLRIEIEAGRDGAARFDEVEIYEATPLPADQVAAWTAGVRRGPQGPHASAGGPEICLGSNQFLDEAAKRLLALCRAGVCFLMFDGTWFSGDCDDPAHGHARPYRVEDHMRACVELARRVHAKYPQVLIEMHDMLAGGAPQRMTPVYYKYGLPGSYDDNWGFELMWDPMADLKAGRARSLYDYNLGCNVPLYLHIDLRKDNANCVVLWWYASTCRHLGIGGTHRDPAVVKAQQAAMARYAQLAEFYKHGDFYGIEEAIHVHTLPGRGAAVVNVFNLSDQPRTIVGQASLASLGLDPQKPPEGGQPKGGQPQSGQPWATVADGQLRIEAALPAWGAAVAEIQ
jgi:hypothetical protein